MAVRIAALLVVLGLLGIGIGVYVTSPSPIAPEVAAQSADGGAASDGSAGHAAPDGRPKPPLRVRRTPIPAERSPHPDYPSPRKARTDKLFLLEEPDRGPLVTSAELPSERGLSWITRPYCVTGHDRIICARGQGRTSATHWRLGRRRGRLVIAQRKFGPRIIDYTLLSYEGRRLKQMVRLDAYRTVVWSRHFDPDGSYVSRMKNGANALDGCGSIKLERGERGRVTAASCRQWSGAPMQDILGVVTSRYARDGRGFIRETTRLDAKGEPVAGHDTVHRRVYRRDRQGRVRSLRYYDTRGFPTMSTRSGCYGWRYRYDRRGLRRSKTCLGADGKVAARPSGVGRYAYEHDGAGCLTAITYQGAGTSARHRVRKRTYRVDDHCKVSIERCFGAGGRRTRCGIGEPAEYRYERDALGRVVSVRHFAANRQPGKHPAYDVFEVRSRYDERGNRIERSCHDTAGSPVECSSTGFHAVRSKFDHAARRIEERFFDRHLQPTTNLETYVRHSVYDNYDHLYESLSFDRRGQLIDSHGMAVRRVIYDRGHRIFGLLLFDRRNKPARYHGCYVGRTCPPRGKPWHAMRVMRRENGSVESNLFFDEHGQLIYTVECNKHRCWK